MISKWNARGGAIVIRFDETVCRNLDAASRREWLETNGIGGFASSTITGLNTRRYHGLLVAATKPPVGRMVLLSKLEETIIVDGRRFRPVVQSLPGHPSEGTHVPQEVPAGPRGRSLRHISKSMGDHPKRASRRRNGWRNSGRYIEDEGLGQIPEVFDGDAPHRAGGCLAQAWSVAELLRSLVEDIGVAQRARRVV